MTIRDSYIEIKKHIHDLENSKLEVHQDYITEQELRSLKSRTKALLERYLQLKPYLEDFMDLETDGIFRNNRYVLSQAVIALIDPDME